MRWAKVVDKKINKMSPVFIVAEISGNHGQDFNRAVSLIKKAKECGVDAVKFQTYTPDTITLDSANKYFKVRHPKWGGQTLYQLYKKSYTPWSWFKKLKKTADELGLVFFSTAFDKTAVDFLEELNVPFHKVASFELVDLPLIEYMANTGKPIMMSTGMATLSEIKEAVYIAKRSGVKKVYLLKCVSGYPADPQEMNLHTIPHMRKLFKCPVGLSDHTLVTGVSVAAVALGANIIEKHFTLSRKIGTPDSFFSIEPAELKDMVKNIRTVEKAIGGVHYGPAGEELENKNFRRSLFAVENISKGEIFTDKNIRSIRPSYGIKPKYLKSILGKKAKKDLKMGTPLKLSLVNQAGK